MNNKNTTVAVTFHYEDNFDYSTSEKFTKKIQQFVDNTDVPVIASVFIARSTCEAIFVFDEIYMDKDDWKKTERRLTTLINSHKQPATWGFATHEIRQSVKVGN